RHAARDRRQAEQGDHPRQQPAGHQGTAETARHRDGGRQHAGEAHGVRPERDGKVQNRAQGCCSAGVTGGPWPSHPSVHSFVEARQTKIMTAYPAGARYFYMVTFEIDPADEPLFNEIYDTEHIPSISKVPGVLGVVRFRDHEPNERGWLVYSALY